MSKAVNWLKSEMEDYSLLLRSIPGLTLTIFTLSVVCANLMANKELVSFKYLAMDAGYAFSWLMFLCMDVICKRWGAKASIKISLLALLINLAVCLSFNLLSRTSGMWSAYYSTEDIAVNDALNATFGGTWYVVLGSALAFAVSSVVNALLNSGIGKRLRIGGFGAFAFRSYLSTIIAQLVDNLIFSTFVSKLFFGWTWTQVITCSATGALMELLFEILFSGLGYRIVSGWEREGVGSDYLERVTG